MDYKLSEIAEVLEVHPDTVYRSYIPAGCPYEKDDKGISDLIPGSPATSSQRNVEIISEPSTKGDVPSTPEFCNIPREVGECKVLH